MRIPIRATYARAPRGSSEPLQRVSSVYADVPDELMLGTLAQCARSDALHAHDEQAAELIARAMDRACATGKITMMT